MLQVCAMLLLTTKTVQVLESCVPCIRCVRYFERPQKRLCASGRRHGEFGFTRNSRDGNSFEELEKSGAQTIFMRGPTAPGRSSVRRAALHSRNTCILFGTNSRWWLTEQTHLTTLSLWHRRCNTQVTSFTKVDRVFMTAAMSDVPIDRISQYRRVPQQDQRSVPSSVSSLLNILLR